MAERKKPGQCRLTGPKTNNHGDKTMNEQDFDCYVSNQELELLFESIDLHYDQVQERFGDYCQE